MKRAKNEINKNNIVGDPCILFLFNEAFSTCWYLIACLARLLWCLHSWVQIRLQQRPFWLLIRMFLHGFRNINVAEKQYLRRIMRSVTFSCIYLQKGKKGFTWMWCWFSYLDQLLEYFFWKNCTYYTIVIADWCHCKMQIDSLSGWSDNVAHKIRLLGSENQLRGIFISREKSWFDQTQIVEGKLNSLWKAAAPTAARNFFFLKK